MCEGGYKCILQYVLLLHALLQVLNVVIAMHYGMMFSFLKLVVGPAAVHINLLVRIIQLHLLYIYIFTSWIAMMRIPFAV